MIFPVPDKTALWIIKVCAVGILLLCVWLHGHSRGVGVWKSKFDAATAAHKAVLDDLAAKTARAARLAEDASKAAAVERQATDKRYEDAKHQAQQDQADLRRSLRGGTVRLQPWWTPDLSGRAVGQGAADAAQADAAIRADSTSRIVAAGDRDAAMMHWLYENWKAEHDAGIKAGCFVEVAP